MKKIFLIVLILSITACSSDFRQEYATYQDFSESVTQRNKSWFFDSIGHDAYNLKSVSSIGESLFCFSVFQYKDTNYYKSILNSNEYVLSTKLEFIEMLKKHLNKKPKWFINENSIQVNNLFFYKKGRWYIANDYENKIIYSVLSN